MSQLPLMISCPEHGCRLELTPGDLATVILWQQINNVQPTPADPLVAAMDRRTHEALTTGAVGLPGRSAHAGVWFRLLRTLLDELNTLTSKLRASTRATLQQIWQATDSAPRGGQLLWRPYESLTWPTQQAMLTAAAAAIHLAQTGQIHARGSLAGLLQPQRAPAVYGGDPPPYDLMGALRAVVDAASLDPGSASRLLTMLTRPDSTRASFESIRDLLLLLDIPEPFLPTYDEIHPRETEAVPGSRWR